MDPSLRVVVIGAGAIGGITAALMRKGGVDVTLVCKHQNIATLAEGRGLHVTGHSGDLTVPVHAGRARSLPGRQGVALCSVQPLVSPPIWD